MALVVEHAGKKPDILAATYIAGNVTLIGDIHFGRETGVWFGAVLRADTNSISVGERSNIQDLCVLHVDADHALNIGTFVTVGHRVILHGCTIGDRVIVGMGAIVMNGAVVGSDTIIAAGSVVTEGMSIPPGSLTMGVPAKVKRMLTEEEKHGIVQNAEHYVRLAHAYR
ncbi:MAG: gamma carbonic anhydrase family protein [Deltaproteobacteria bacterium]|nr:gamma carbonic anhydrase family protein [Deltaproteobacteria bacterium]